MEARETHDKAKAIIWEGDRGWPGPQNNSEDRTRSVSGVLPSEAGKVYIQGWAIAGTLGDQISPTEQLLTVHQKSTLTFPAPCFYWEEPIPH